MKVKTFITHLFLLTTFLVTSAQSSSIGNGDSLNMKDASNQKQGWWKVYNTDGKYKGYEMGQLVERPVFGPNITRTASKSTNSPLPITLQTDMQRSTTELANYRKKVFGR
jgi:hypothetical protein